MKTITITQKEYGKLVTAYYKLMALQNSGVASWDGYKEAVSTLDEAIENLHDEEDI